MKMASNDFGNVVDTFYQALQKTQTIPGALKAVVDAIPETEALWVRIDEEHLPKEGDEVGYWSVTGLGELWLVRTVSVNWNLSQCRIAGWTHYRPINAPTGSVYRELERQLAEATAEAKRITDMLSDSATVHVNILRGTIKISKANLIHAAGLPANIEAQLAEARKATEWKPFETAPTNGTEIIVYREDAGVFMASFRPSAGDDGEFGPQMNGDECWFDNYGDDLTGDLPTSWMPKPQGPITAPRIPASGPTKQKRPEPRG